MKLEDINETVFMQFDPEVQKAIIEIQQVDPIVAGIFAIVMLITFFLFLNY